MNEKMRGALEAVKRELQTIEANFRLVMEQDSKPRTYDPIWLISQIDEALKSEPTTSELVAELRKRQEIEEYVIPKGRKYRLVEEFSTEEDVVDFQGDGGAIILRITDIPQT